MGGVNPMLPVGFNPGAIKLRSSSGLNMAEAAGGPEVDESSLRKWMHSIVDEAALDPDSGSSLKDVLHDGKLLCKFINAVSGKDPIKINMGKFNIMFMENINSFLGAAEAMGVPRQQLFQPTDLFDGTDMQRVLQTLDAIRRIVEARAK
eukprot:jgi/Hompol1/2056/HPOL_002040-RA